MHIIALGLSVAVVLAANTARADVKQDARGWYCGSQEDWEVASLRLAPKLVLNNFFFEEGKSFQTKMPVLRVKYSAINRTGRSHNMTSQIVGFDEHGAPTLAVSAAPSFDIVGTGTATVSESVYVTASVLPETKKICASFAIEGRKK